LEKIGKQFSILLLLLLLATPILSFLGFQLFGNSPERRSRPEGRESRMVRILPHWGTGQIAQELKEKGIIVSPWAFQAVVFLRGTGTRLQIGDYAFPPGMSLLDVLKKLESGDIFHVTVTIPEGWTVREIARYLEARGLASEERFWQLAHDQELLRRYGIRGSSLEGYLFPDTYYLRRGMKEEEIIDRMFKRFLQIYAQECQGKAASLGWTRHQVVTLGSLIEAETPAEEERELVSSVFHRRLKIGMPLQCDPTVMYALWGREGKRARLTRRHLTFPSPYNTYVHRGLPPGPICNPGAASLRAAVSPRPSPYLYFVSKGNGSHHFSSNLYQHYRAVLRYQSSPDRT